MASPAASTHSVSSTIAAVTPSPNTSAKGSMSSADSSSSNVSQSGATEPALDKSKTSGSLPRSKCPINRSTDCFYLSGSLFCLSLLFSLSLSLSRQSLNLFFLHLETAYKVDRYGFVLQPKEAETIQKVLDPATAQEVRKEKDREIVVLTFLLLSMRHLRLRNSTKQSSGPN
jgi:hypothetical protein